MTPTILVDGLTRRYRGQLALDDVTFDVQGASITGLLGRNGAGKTTLLRIIAGHEFASAGLAGHRPLPHHAERDRAYRPACRPGRGPAGRRPHHYPPHHGLR